MLNLIGLIITFFLAIVLLGKRAKTRADYLLMIWLWVIGVHLGLYYSVVSGAYLRFAYLLGTEIPLPLVHGPLLYLYISSLTRSRTTLRRWPLHFLPVLLAYLYVTPFYLLATDRKIWVYQHEGAGFRERQVLLLIAIVVSGVSYAVLSWVKLQRQYHRIAHPFSGSDRIRFAWLRYLIVGIALIWTTILLGEEEFIFGGVAVFVCLVGYFGIRQPGIFTEPPGPAWELENVLAGTEAAFPIFTSPASEAEPVLLEKNKYARSGLNSDMGQHIHQNLEDLMTRERLFTDPELTLAQLSDKLGTNANHLSQVVNTIENKSFYDYINALRTAEFIRISGLPENQKYTLLHLALECGFNSKTSFNRNFKKHTGLSPSAFLAQKDIHLI